MTTTTGVSRPRRRRRLDGGAGLLAWLALIGLLLSPLAPRSSTARSSEETEVEFFDVELEDALAVATAQVVESRQRARVPPPPIRRVDHAAPSIATAPPPVTHAQRWNVPRRVPPDDDPDERNA